MNYVDCEPSNEPGGICFLVVMWLALSVTFGLMVFVDYYKPNNAVKYPRPNKGLDQELIIFTDSGFVAIGEEHIMEFNAEAPNAKE